MMFYQDNDTTLHNGDCRNMNALEDGSVQCVVTSPPYWGLRKYAGVPDLIWGGDAECEHEWTGEGLVSDVRKSEVVAGKSRTEERFYGEPSRKFDGNHQKHYQDTSCSLCGAWRGSYGLEPTPELYVEHTVEVLREVRRVLRDDGVVFWNIGDSYSSGGRGDRRPVDRDSKAPESVCLERIDSGLKPKDLVLIPARVMLAVQADGWYVRSVIIWDKPNPMPESVRDRPTTSHEYILMLTKSARYYYDSEAVRENAKTNTARATDFAAFGSSALTPEGRAAVGTHYGAAHLRGQLDLRQSQVTIDCTVTLETKSFEIIKKICLSIVTEVAEWDFVIDLQAVSSPTSLAAITCALENLAANDAPVRATIIDAAAPECGACFTDAVNTVPGADTGTTTEPVSEALAVLAGIANEGHPALVTLHSEQLGTPLLIRGTLRSSHIAHDTINTIEKQGRNLRSVWSFSTHGFPDAHFATFPEALPERCIKAATPEVGCCEKCGAPWERIVEVSGGTTGRSWHDHDADLEQGQRAENAAKGGHGYKRESKGWQPTCECEYHDPEFPIIDGLIPPKVPYRKVPSVVLDPFVGSGTTLWVAKRLGRKSVGYELSGEYCELAVKRLPQQGLL